MANNRTSIIPACVVSIIDTFWVQDIINGPTANYKIWLPVRSCSSVSSNLTFPEIRYLSSIFQWTINIWRNVILLQTERIRYTTPKRKQKGEKFAPSHSSSNRHDENVLTKSIHTSNNTKHSNEQHSRKKTVKSERQGILPRLGSHKVLLESTI